nr:vegetative cell wall protein gp1-like [Aegilops tauschii subsp. strangulata]
MPRGSPPPPVRRGPRARIGHPSPRRPARAPLPSSSSAPAPPPPLRRPTSPAPPFAAARSSGDFTAPRPELRQLHRAAPELLRRSPTPGLFPAPGSGGPLVARASSGHLRRPRALPAGASSPPAPAASSWPDPIWIQRAGLTFFFSPEISKSFTFLQYMPMFIAS